MCLVMSRRCYVVGSDLSCSFFCPRWFRAGFVSRCLRCCVGVGFALTSLWFRFVLFYVGAASCMFAVAFWLPDSPSTASTPGSVVVLAALARSHAPPRSPHISGAARGVAQPSHGAAG